MMETAKIRKAGYAIRHGYKDFVARYRFLIKGITTKTDVRVAASKICKEILQPTMPNYALGKTKIFLKEQHDRHLEKVRSDMYSKAIAIIQRGFRRIIFRKYMQRYRNAVVVIQKNWRAKGPRENYNIMQNGFKRLQAAILSREASNRYQNMRNSVIELQARCRGYLTRRDLAMKISEKSQRLVELAQMKMREEQELKAAGRKQWKQEAEIRYLTRLAALNRELKLDNERKTYKDQTSVVDDDAKVVDDVFSFLTELAQTPKMSRAVTTQRHTPSFKVSKMISYLESKSRNVKPIPTKLLSRPVNYYDSTTRL
jgi:myosin-7